MKILFIILVILTSVNLTSCKSKTPLILKDQSNSNERNNKLFVFVGEKIDVKELHEDDSWDLAIKAKYKIIKRVYGDYNDDIIEFTAHDHYGYPPFIKFKNALLFVVEYNGKYYQEMYQYFDVYKTKNNRWAGAYSKEEYGYARNYHDGANIKPEKIEFIQEVSYPLTTKTDTTDNNEGWYPEPFYEKKGGKAIAIYGNYIEDLFLLKKEGVLTSRGLFGDKPPGEIEVLDTEMAEIITPKPLVDVKFQNFWRHIIKSIKLDSVKFKQIALDSLSVCYNIVPMSDFVNYYYTKVFDSTLFSKRMGISKTSYWISPIDTSAILPFVKRELVKYRDTYSKLIVDITMKENERNSKIVRFEFVKATNGYKLIGIEDYTGECFR